MRTKQIIEKADMTLADLASGGLLNPEQASAFFRQVQISPTILRSVRMVPMSGPQRNIDKIGFGSRILKPAVSATALDIADRSKPTTGQVQLNTKEVIAEVNLPYDVIEDNIERGRLNQAGASSDPKPVQGGFKDTIVDMIAERVAIDLEELGLLGDTAHATDTYLQLADGWLKLMTSNIVNQASATITKTMFKNGLQTLPKQFHRNLMALSHYTSINQELEYRETLSDRATNLGDNMIQGRQPVFGMGVPLRSAAQMPEDTGMLTFPQNLIWGVQRQVSFEVDKDIRERVFIIVVTCRCAFQIEDELATVKYTNIG
ncbi:MAG: hypothetical protein GWN00_01425 [Aliifodinibius sp.]|nr:phage major capsid protein [Phycisphaerae bacterium]NIR62341.1 phage major capsid protein [candidate division Zixibacteria bacterium]NIT54939.1 phage major capsid protein [Fodinibius sp.]NIW43353.1 hypothetical protein [Gammaproteobacteria bacterium]NIU12574.1 phage major capsid protein [candidate division Zixibacteria bacterium]